MADIRLKALAVLIATTLAGGAALAQTSTSPAPANPSASEPPSPTTPSSPGMTPAPPMTTTPPSATSPAAPGSTTTPSSPSTSDAPSSSTGSTMGRGADDALATPEDRAKCAALSGTAQAECIAAERRAREADERLRTSRDATSPSGRPRM